MRPSNSLSSFHKELNNLKKLNQTNNFNNNLNTNINTTINTNINNNINTNINNINSINQLSNNKIKKHSKSTQKNYNFIFNKSLPLNYFPEKNNRYIVLDTETTGLNFEKDTLIAINAIEIINCELTGIQFNTYINPRHKKNSIYPNNNFSYFIEDYANERDDNQKKSLKSFLNFVNNSQIITHNVIFDLNFINKSLKENNLPEIDICKCICSLMISRKRRREGLIKPFSITVTVQNLCKLYNVQVKDCDLHHGNVDATVLARVICKMWDDNEVRYLNLNDNNNYNNKHNSNKNKYKNKYNNSNNNNNSFAGFNKMANINLNVNKTNQRKLENDNNHTNKFSNCDNYNKQLNPNNISYDFLSNKNINNNINFPFNNNINFNNINSNKFNNNIIKERNISPNRPFYNIFNNINNNNNKTVSYNYCNLDNIDNIDKYINNKGCSHFKPNNAQKHFSSKYNTNTNNNDKNIFDKLCNNDLNNDTLNYDNSNIKIENCLKEKENNNLINIDSINNNEIILSSNNSFTFGSIKSSMEDKNDYLLEKENIKQMDSNNAKKISKKLKGKNKENELSNLKSNNNNEINNNEVNSYNEINNNNNNKRYFLRQRKKQDLNEEHMFNNVFGEIEKESHKNKNTEEKRKKIYKDEQNATYINNDLNNYNNYLNNNQS